MSTWWPGARQTQRKFLVEKLAILKRGIRTTKCPRKRFLGRHVESGGIRTTPGDSCQPRLPQCMRTGVQARARAHVRMANSHEFKVRHCEARVSNPQIIAYLNLGMPSECYNPRGWAHFSRSNKQADRRRVNVHPCLYVCEPYDPSRCRGVPVRCDAAHHGTMPGRLKSVYRIVTAGTQQETSYIELQS